MQIGGRFIGIGVLVLTALLVVASIWYTHQLDKERAQAVAQLVSTPQYAGCRYDISTCPQAEDTSVPHSAGIGIVILAVLLGLYLIRTEHMQKKILGQLEQKHQELGKNDRRTMLLELLTSDERKVMEGVLAQPGITQATLRLRTGMSKPKLSMLLKALEERNVIVKEENGRTNTVHLKKEF
jgi:uncharacterized membrane protein